MKNELKIANWARAEQRRKNWLEWRIEFLAHVRLIFVLLLMAAVFVFVFNWQSDIQRIASAGLHRIMPSSDKLREKALNYEKQVNEINNP